MRVCGFRSPSCAGARLHQRRGGERKSDADGYVIPRQFCPGRSCTGSDVEDQKPSVKECGRLHLPDSGPGGHHGAGSLRMQPAAEKTHDLRGDQRRCRRSPHRLGRSVRGIPCKWLSPHLRGLRRRRHGQIPHLSAGLRHRILWGGDPHVHRGIRG